MATYTGARVGPGATADWTDDFDVDYSDTWAGVSVRRVIASDGGVVHQPGEGVRLGQIFSPVAAAVVIPQAQVAGFVHAMQAWGLTHFDFYTGNSYDGVTFVLVSAYRAADKTTLVGIVKEQLLDLTESPAPNVRLHFRATNVEQLYAATKSDDNGGYIVFLDAGGAEYEISGFRPESCKVFENVRLDEHPSSTDIILRVPLACVIDEEETMGEPVDDVLNREIGYHNYEPVKTAAVLTASGAYSATSAGSLPVDVAIGAEVDVINTTLASAVAIDSVRVSSDGDAEFRFFIGGFEVVPRKRTTKFDDDGELIGAPLYGNAGAVLRVVCINMETGTPASSIKAQATIAGRTL